MRRATLAIMCLQEDLPSDRDSPMSGTTRLESLSLLEAQTLADRGSSLCIRNLPQSSSSSTTSAAMTGKRHHDASAGDGDAKRLRSNNGSPVPAPGSKTAQPVGMTAKEQIAARLAAAKAKIAAVQAKKAAEAKGVSKSPVNAPPVSTTAVKGSEDVEAKKAQALRRIAELKARNAAQRNGTASSPVPQATAGEPKDFAAQQAENAKRGAAAKARLEAVRREMEADPAQRTGQAPPKLTDAQARIAEARARAAELARKGNSKPSAPTPPPRVDVPTAKGGLGIGLHPSLLGDQPVPATGKGRARGQNVNTARENQKAVKVNPYLSTDEGRSKDHDGDSSAFDPTIATRSTERKSRALLFAPKGKYIAQAAALKQQARLEEMKKRIALETRKVEIEEAADKSFLVAAPPTVEWWDEGLLPAGQDSYEDWEKADRNKIDTEDSIITIYIQHPVLLAAPQDKFAPAPKPMMLTPKEMKKVRRQRRMEDMKEQQAKIRLGLIPPPPPKVKKSNMMRVFGEQAVQDPTAVEARVNREIAERQANHEKSNEERRLTKEQRAEKLKQQQKADEAKGVKIAVFRVDRLSSGKHRFQVDINAKQNDLTGIVVMHPDMNVVIVEGGVHSVNAYKKLMLNRVKWTENTLPLSNNSSTTFTPSRPSEATGPQRAAETWLNPLTELGELKDLSDNKCVLVWEGDERQRAFRKWGHRVCETDGEARDILGRSKMENMWSLAKGMKP